MMVILAVTAGCGLQNRSIERFAGSLRSASKDCAALDATMVVQDGKVVFAPNSATFLLTGTAAAGQITASATRPGFDHKPYSATLAASVVGDKVAGSYNSPDCRYDVALTRY